MRLFHWLCAIEIPPGCDLRNRGWQLAEADAARAQAPVALAHRAYMDGHSWTRLRHAHRETRHDRVLMLGVHDSVERARLLGLGFGDVLGETPALDEVEARAARVAAQAGMLPARRTIGPLTLDLLARDGLVDGRALALHPREFALIWRLADKPGTIVAKRTLLREVWRLWHVPETNSLAVHVFRLRAKLAAAGLADLVQTAPEGGYWLAVPVEGGSGPAIPMLTQDSRSRDLVAAAPADFRPEDYRHGS